MAVLPPLINLSPAYLFGNTKEAFWLVVQRPLTEGLSNGLALRGETLRQQEPTDHWFLAWKISITLSGFRLAASFR